MQPDKHASACYAYIGAQLGFSWGSGYVSFASTWLALIAIPDYISAFSSKPTVDPNMSPNPNPIASVNPSEPYTC